MTAETAALELANGLSRIKAETEHLADTTAELVRVLLDRAVDDCKRAVDNASKKVS